MLRPADATERGAASPVALLFDNYREHVRLVAWIAGFAHGTDSAAVLRSSTEGLACGLLSIRPMKNQPIDDTAQPALQRDPDEWKTGDEPMTDAQKSYLQTLCRETGQEFDDSLSKADASKLIDELRERSPRLASE